MYLVEISFLQLKSYDGKKSTGSVDIIKDFDASLKNRHVVIVEDIIDTGTTLKFLLNKIKPQGLSFDKSNFSLSLNLVPLMLTIMAFCFI